MSEGATTPRWVRIAGAIGALTAFAAIEVGLGHALPAPQRHAASVAAAMICLWMTEALPIHITALIPLLAFPLLGVFARPPAVPTPLLRAVLPREPGPLYELVRTVDGFLDSNIFLFMGGMCIAAAMEQWNLHRRVALSIMRQVGGRSSRLLPGFLLATAFISLWLSNTATAVMMLPIGLAVVRQLEEEEGRRLPHVGLAFMLAVAYASSVGGIGTKIGTAPNGIFCGFAERLGRPVDFLEFLTIGIPFVVLFLPVVGWTLARVATPDRLGVGRGRDVIDVELARLGPMRPREKFVSCVFLVAAAAWIGGPLLAKAFGIRGTQMDALTAMLAAAALLAGRAVDGPALRRVPWSVLLLFGGSFAMAEGIGASGFVDTMSRTLAGVAAWPPLAVSLTVAAVTVAVTAAASNTAATTLMMTVLQPLGLSAMATSTIAASCDFALPAGTPPNAIVFASGYVTVPRMMKVGIPLDVAGALLAGLWGYFGVRWILS